MADQHERPSSNDLLWDTPTISTPELRGSSDPAESFAAAQSLFHEGRLEDAWEEAEMARAGFAAIDPLSETDVLYLSAAIAKERGYYRIGEERIARAIADRTDLAEGTVPLSWYELHATLAGQNGELATAAAAWETAVKVARALRDATGQGVDRLCVALRALGDTHLAQGYNVPALRAFRELVEEARGMAAASEDPHAFRHLTSALHRLGDALHVSNDPAGAAAAYRDAVRETKRVAAALGESTDTLWDLSVGLNRLGAVQLESEQTQAAIASFEQSVEARRAFVDMTSRDPQALLGLASSLSKLSAALHHTGDEAAALAAAEEAAALDQEASAPATQQDTHAHLHPLTMVPGPVF